MGSRDLGWFLIFVGAVWYVLTMPLDLSLLTDAYALPLALIIFGSLYVTIGYVNEPNLSHALSVIFFIFIILMVKANFFNFTLMPFNFTGLSYELTENYGLTQEASLTNLHLECDVCESMIKSSLTDDLIVDVNYSSNGLLSSNVSDDLISVILRSDKVISGGKAGYELPLNPGNTSVKVGVGKVVINLSGLNESHSMLSLSSGVSSIKLYDLSGYDFINLSTGVGSIEVFINEVSGFKELIIDSGVGSIDLFIAQGVEFMIESSTGLGSVNNAYGPKTSNFDESADKLLIRAKAGVGSITVNK